MSRKRIRQKRLVPLWFLSFLFRRASRTHARGSSSLHMPSEMQVLEWRNGWSVQLSNMHINKEWALVHPIAEAFGRKNVLYEQQIPEMMRAAMLYFDWCTRIMNASACCGSSCLQQYTYRVLLHSRDISLWDRVLLAIQAKSSMSLNLGKECREWFVRCCSYVCAWS